MAVLTRKQREIRQREGELLDVARRMLAERGYLGLKMDRIAEQMEYSKGTMYQHFSCKEEVLIALAIQTGEKRTRMFRRAANLVGRSRERITAIGIAAELFVRLYPDHFRVEQTIRSASLWEKTSAERQRVLRMCESNCMGVVAGVIRDAVASEDLVLDRPAVPEDVAFALWALSFGASSLMATSEPLGELGIGEPYASVRAAIIKLLDGFKWQPISDVCDYNPVIARILTDVFPEEAKLAFGGDTSQVQLR